MKKLNITSTKPSIKNKSREGLEKSFEMWFDNNPNNKKVKAFIRSLVGNSG